MEADLCRKSESFDSLHQVCDSKGGDRPKHKNDHRSNARKRWYQVLQHSNRIPVYKISMNKIDGRRLSRDLLNPNWRMSKN